MDLSSGAEVYVKALFDYEEQNETELLFVAGDIIRVTDVPEAIPGWLEGELNEDSQLR